MPDRELAGACEGVSGGGAAATADGLGVHAGADRPSAPSSPSPAKADGTASAPLRFSLSP